MAKKAAEMGADTFQFFTRNPRGGSAKPLNEQDLRAMTTFMEDRGFTKIIAHAPYTLNPCSADPAVREFAVRVMTEDLALTERIPNAFYNIHPGSHGGQGVETGIEETVHCLNEALHSDQKTEVLLETMSGKGNEIGSSFEEIAEIIHRTKQNEHLGVCFDTCHVFSSGYDIREALDAPRWQWIKDNEIQVETGFSESVIDSLRQRGHIITVMQDSMTFGRGQIIWRRDDGTLIAGSEPRTDGLAAPW